jgi:predicted esterase
MREFNVAVTTHGRVLADEAGATAPLRILAGFHGYAQSADEMMTLVQAIPADASWTRLSIQALHRFYRGRSQVTVASWMTRQDREVAIADNLEYVAAALETTPHDEATPIVYAGFSQGVAMAFRAALRGRARPAAIIAIGGDVPPELLADAALPFPKVLLARGDRDDWFTAAKFEADTAALRARGIALEPLQFDGAHEWNSVVSAAVSRFLAGIQAAGPSRRGDVPIA